MMAMNKKKWVISFFIAAVIIIIALMTKDSWEMQLTVYSKLIFAILIIFVLSFSILTGIKSKENIKRDKYRLKKCDYILIILLTLICSVFSFYKLGNNYSPSSYWKSGETGEYAVVEFDKTVKVTALAYFGNISENGRYDIYYEVEDGSGEYSLFCTISNTDEAGNDMKESFFKWCFTELDDIITKRIIIESDCPGWGINEIAFFEGENTKNYTVIPVNVIDEEHGDLSVGRPSMLFDEQALVPNEYNYMNSTYFDEIYFPRTAYEQLNGFDIYETTHPPLGKIIISIGIKLFGMNPFGWRVMGTIFGILLVPFMYLFGIKIFKSSKYAFIAAFLLMFDFMRLAQTRLATIDMYATFFIIGSYYFMYDYFVNRDEKSTIKDSLKPLFWCGIMFGLGIATKWSCFYSAPGLAFIFFLTKFLEFLNIKKQKQDIKKWVIGDFLKTCVWCILFFVIIPGIIYILTYIPYMPSNLGSSLIETVIDNQKNMYNYHKNLVATHAFQSAWWTWPFNIRPLWLYTTPVNSEGMRGTIVSFGNPAVWLPSFLAVFAALGFIWVKKDRRGIVLLIAFAFQYFPWILVTRIVFIYSYFTALPFAILLFVYCLQCINLNRNTKAFNIVLCIYLISVFVLFVVFFPVLMGVVVPETYISALKFLPSWCF